MTVDELYTLLFDAGLPVITVHSTDGPQYSRELTAEEYATEQQILSEYDINQPSLLTTNQLEAKAVLQELNGFDVVTGTIPGPDLSKYFIALFKFDHPEWVDENGIIAIP